ncbi:GntR family transcriptional regulator [Streptomyces sp. NPDC020917]|uniref:GntR family transcriptional regulator n=1 Tax=Streptomyces sp. NPDC020917 TaxID=3365102 RepID=UPI0037A2E272
MGNAPLYQRIKAELRAAIARGEYEPGSPFVTQRELCERYDVSTTTAVKALNDLVTEGLLVRQQGRGTFVAERGPQDSRMSGGAASSIACIAHGVAGPYVSTMISGVESVCSELGYRMYLADTARPGESASPEREANALREALDSHAAGIVLYPVQGHANGDLIMEIQRRGVPLVLVDRYRSDIPTDVVVVDNFTIGYELTQHLIAAGHTRILTLWSETDVTSVWDRLSGHVKALQEAGVAVRPEFTLLRNYLDLPEEGRRAMLRSALEGTEPATAALCSQGFVVASAAADLVALGLSVPNDFELAGMDDEGPFDLLPLTAFAAQLPNREMGATAMRLLAQRIHEGDKATGPQRITLPTKVRTRDQTSAHLRVVGGAAS